MSGPSSDVETGGAAKPETRGIELIPPSQRHGRPRSLLWVWAAPNASFLTFTMGGVMVAALGLSLGQALIVTAADYDRSAGLMGAFERHLPAWFFPIFTIAVIIAAIALNGMTTYSASLSLQALGIPIKCIPSAVIVYVIGTVLTIVAVTVYDFTTSVSVMLQLVVVAAGPLMAVYAADVLLRRNDYDGPGLIDDTYTSPFWYRGGWSWAGLLALLIGGAASTLCISTDVYVGPISAATGLDLSIPSGIVVAALVYWVLSRTGLVKSER